MQINPTATAFSASLLRPRGADPIQVGPLRLDPLTREVWLDDQPVHLTPREYGVLRVLIHHPGRVFTRRELYKAVWGFDEMRSRSLDAAASRLRAKLAMVNADYGLVVCAQRVGYQLMTLPPATSGRCPLCGHESAGEAR